MKPSKQKFDVKSDPKLTSWCQKMTSWQQRKTSTSDGRIKLFPSMKTINLPKVRLTLLNYNLSKNEKIQKMIGAFDRCPLDKERQ